MRLRDDLAVIALVTVLAALCLWLWLGWASSRDEAGMARAVPVATTAEDPPGTAGDRGASESPPEIELEPRGWPADWPTRHEIALIAWGLHHAQPEASSMAVERQASGETVVTNPPEAPVADEAIRSIICDGRTWDCDTALRVARCESNYNAHAVGRQGERGWFQIWAKWHMDRIGRLGYTVDDLFDPAANTAVAYDLWRADGWRHWSCARGLG